MWRHRLKPLRVAGALVVGSGLTAALMDFRDAMPASVGHWLGAVQMVPATIAFATGAGLAAGVIVVVILAVTLLVGRVYCSVVCPLGVLQDGIARLAAWRRERPSRLPHARPQNALRYGFLGLTLAGVAAGWGGLTLALLDPYSSYGRIAAGLFRPLLVLANNAVVGFAELLGFPLLYRVETPWLGAGVLVLPLVMLTLVGVLAVRRGRLFCNTVCPVGTLLGLVARRAAWRLTIEQSACVRCGECLPVCKAQCIDLRAGVIDASRCVACYNCIGACPELGIAYDYAWTPPVPEPGTETEPEEETDPDGEPEPEPAAPLSEGVAIVGAGGGAADSVRRSLVRSSDPQDAFADAPMPAPARWGQGPPPALNALPGLPANPARRVFLGGAMAATAASLSTNLFAAGMEPPPDPNQSTAVCPPGAGSVDRYLNRCTACHLCVSACPTQVLRPALLEYGFAGYLRPRLDYTRSFCNFDCRRCGEVCPTGAIALLALPEKQVTRVGRAVLTRELCVVEKDGTDCAACSEHCPTKAVHTVPFRDNLRLPEVRDELCIGCGACEFACPVVPKKAILVTGRRRHERAEKVDEAKLAPANPTEDFPF
jgi:ferredoxin